MLDKYIEDHIHVIDAVENWQDSITIASKKLLEKGYIENDYIDAMINNVLENGSYMVIMPEVALPHARPKDMVKKTTLSILKVNQGVVYPEDKKIRLVIVLAATDGDAHLEIISELSEILVDADIIKLLKEAKTVQELKMALEVT